MAWKGNYFIIIVCTIISVLVMLLYGNDNALSNIPDEKIEIKIEQKTKDRIAEDMKKQENVDSKVEDAKQDSNNNSGNHKEEENSNQQENENRIISEEGKNEIYDNNTQNKVYDENKTLESSDDKDKTASVFKVSTEIIKESLTLKEKQKLLNAALKLSRVDYEKIKQYLYATDQEQGVIDALKLLKMRLSDKDYNNVKSVASKYINMEAIENDTKK